MPVRRPTKCELEAIGQQYGFSMTEGELDAYYDRILLMLEAYDELDRLPEPKPPVRFPRHPGRRPTPEENPTGGWAWLCSIKGNDDGPLAGKRVAIKDNIPVAGMPMTVGSQLLEGFVPDIDSTVVTRILEAGGEIVGKAVCENLCFSGGSHTSHPWLVKNHRNPQHHAGGSSSGSAALVGSGACDIALGTDTAGSVRIPSSWSGIFGLKATWGLVPGTGVFPIDTTLDQVGPMARNVRDLAVTLGVIAGRDGWDGRQAHVPTELPDYAAALGQPLNGLRIGVVREAFAWPGVTEPDVDEAVREAAARFEQLGATVREISVPWHRHGIIVWAAIATEGGWAQMVRGDGTGHNWIGYYDTHMIDFYGRSRRTRGHDYPHSVKVVTLLGHYLAERYHGRYHGKGQNMRRAVREAYDEALREVDLLAMPTTPQKAPRLDPNDPVERSLVYSLDQIHNTCVSCVSGHPAVSLPCALSDGLPVGLMLVGRWFEETTVLNAAYAFEQQGWTV